jgi:hypothetical protein
MRRKTYTTESRNIADLRERIEEKPREKEREEG